METLLSRYRSLTVLLLLLMAQLLLLAYQVKTNEEVRLIRIWAVTAVTPLARLVENVRAATSAGFNTLARQKDVLAENRQLKAEATRLKLEKLELETQLASADRAAVLVAFQKQTASKTVLARVIGTGTGANARVVYLDRGSTEGVMRGMAVITAGGIAGKVVSVYPTTSQVTLVTQQGFVAGLISQKHRARGTLRGIGSDHCVVEYLRTDEPLDEGEWFYTSGDDRVFPKGLPVGKARLVKRQAGVVKEIELVPAGLQGSLEEVLIVVQGIHAAIPDETAPPSGALSLLPPPPPEPGEAAAQEKAVIGAGGTDADRLRDKYRRIGESQNHPFGAGPGRVPDFNKQPAAAPAPVDPNAPPVVAKPKPPATAPQVVTPPAANSTPAQTPKP